MSLTPAFEADTYSIEVLFPTSSPSSFSTEPSLLSSNTILSRNSLPKLVSGKLPQAYRIDGLRGCSVGPLRNDQLQGGIHGRMLCAFTPRFFYVMTDTHSV